MVHVLLRRALAPLILLLAVACESTTGGGTAPASDPHAAGGRSLYEKSCARCHALYMPRSHTASEWRFYVRKYGRKARLDRGQRQVVYNYLAGNALVLASDPTGH